MSDPVARLNAALEGRYHIERQLGEGGMATVYLADDLRHERKVALKVLKPEVAAVVGAERFLAEIKTTANLQHPHILPLFDSGEAGGFLFYVMPYVEGESLRDRLDREHQLPVDGAVQIASNVAEALDYAHRHGVIHRDIKPANILLQDGKPVVSDFGIALAVSGVGRRLTETGLSLGTPQYMSPEQATGDQAVGPAADIWAVACVLYEMLVGEPPYGGSTPQAILGKVIAGNPEPITAQRRTVSANVEAAIERGLEKIPADRFGSAEEFAEALADPSFRHREPTRARLLPRVGVASVAALAFLAGALVVGAPTQTPGGGSRPEAQPVVRFKIAGDYANALGRVVAISRDGSTIAHSSRSELFLRAIDASDVAVRLQPNGGQPFFSPDGTWLAYFGGVSANLTRMPVTGGTSVLIVANSERALGGSWGSDDTIVFATTSGLYRVPAEGGEVELLAAPDLSAGELYYAWPDVLPGGRAVLFTIVPEETPSDAASAIAVLDLESLDHRVLLRGGSGARYSEAGHLVYSSGAALYGVAFDVGSLEVGEEPVALDIEELSLVRGAGPDFDISDDGTLVYVPAAGGVGTRRTLAWIGRDGTEEPIPIPPRRYNYARVSPDGSQVAVDVGGVNRDLYVWDLRRATLSRLTYDPAEDFLGHWSPDGRRIFFTSERNGVNNVYARSANGTGEAELVVASPQVQMLNAISSDGTQLITVQEDALDGFDIVAWTLAETPTVDTIVATEFTEINAVLSPDDHWLAFASDRDGRSEIYVTSFSDADRGLMKISIDGGRAPLWSPAGDELYYLSPSGSLMSATVRLTPTFEVGEVTELIPSFLPARVSNRLYDVSPVDGRFLTFRESESVEDGGIVVVVNWAHEMLDRLQSR